MYTKGIKLQKCLLNNLSCGVQFKFEHTIIELYSILHL